MTNWIRRFGPPLLFFFIIIVVWETGVRIYQVPEWILPTPLSIGQEWVSSFVQLKDNLLATMRIALMGLGWGILIGLLIASMLHLVPWLKRMIYPFILLSQNIPMIALAPLLVVWFGFGDLPKLLVVAMVCFFPITIATLDGFNQADRTLIIYMKMSGASRIQRFIKLDCPSAIPSFFSGLKLSVTYSVMGAVIAEWLGAEAGIGKMMTIASKSYQTDRLFVAIGIIVIVSLLLFVLITWIEKMVVRLLRGGENG